MQIRLIATGGTFDKTYDPLTGALGFAATHLERIVARVRLTVPVAIEVPMLIDSLDMTDAHRQAVLDACRRAPEPHLVIVHGTDTMAQTARVLGAAALPATIVLTGAMVPYDVADSDALFNLGYAFACAQHLPAGVWVAMNGRVHPWGDVRKNRDKGVFEATG
jgi:L-asparaginase